MNSATIAAIRFGFALGPVPQPGDAETMLAALRGPDTMGAAFPMVDTVRAIKMMDTATETGRDLRKGVPGAEAASARAREDISSVQRRMARALFARIVDSPDPFRERLALFWADHFTVRRKGLSTLALTGAFIDDAIRPHVAGRFADLLRAAVLHPQMLMYLDQIWSVGPMSRIGRKQGRGLNENLAREVLELHTLGVGAAYGQQDVREFAEILTGLYFNADEGVILLPARAEPGRETVLGNTYGHPKNARIEHVYEVLDDLSVHPDTARHISGKLAAHFVSDVPDPGLVDHLTAAWLRSDGDLEAVYSALLEHPAAWNPVFQKVRQPVDFIGSALRVLGVPGDRVMGLKGALWQDTAGRRLTRMGQPLFMPPGPDGWPEQSEAWITPLGLSMRIRWAMEMPGRLRNSLPDPRDFAVAALGDGASARLRAAVAGADTVAQGVGLVLASPEFNRR